MRRNWFVDVVMDPKMQKSTRAMPSHLKVFGLRKIICVKDENNKALLPSPACRRFGFQGRKGLTTLTRQIDTKLCLISEEALTSKSIRFGLSKGGTALATVHNNRQNVVFLLRRSSIRYVLLDISYIR